MCRNTTSSCRPGRGSVTRRPVAAWRRVKKYGGRASDARPSCYTRPVLAALPGLGDRHGRGRPRRRSRPRPLLRGVRRRAAHHPLARGVRGGARARAFGGPPIFAVHALVYVQFVRLVWPRMRPLWYRVLVSTPASWFVAGTMLAIPWAIAAAAGLPLYGLFVPYLLAALGIAQSFRNGFEQIDLALDGTHVAALARHRSGAERVERPLRLAQITDPHLGPFMSSEAAERRRAGRGRGARPRPLDRRLPDHGVAPRRGRPGARPGPAACARGQGVRVPRQPRPRGAPHGRPRPGQRRGHPARRRRSRGLDAAGRVQVWGSTTTGRSSRARPAAFAAHPRSPSTSAWCCSTTQVPSTTSRR